jgi:hypothetical protein
MVRQTLGDRANAEDPEETHDNAGGDLRVASLSCPNGRRTYPQPFGELGLSKPSTGPEPADQLPKASQVIGYRLGNLVHGAASHLTPMYCLLSYLRDNILSQYGSQGL